MRSETSKSMDNARTRFLTRSRWAAVGAAVAVTLGGGGLIGVSATTSSSTLVPIAPVRILDTRSGSRVGEILSGASIGLQVTGSVATVSEGTKTVVPEGATAITGNLTVVETSVGNYGGYASIYPCGEVPNASNMNFVAGQTLANSVSVPLSSSGEVCIFVFGSAHVLLDVSGYYTTGDVARLASRIAEVEAQVAEPPVCQWFEQMNHTSTGYVCELKQGVVLYADAAGAGYTVWNGVWVGSDALAYGLTPDGVYLVGGNPGSYGTYMYFASSDCSGTAYLKTRTETGRPDSADQAFDGIAYDGAASRRWARVAVNPATSTYFNWRLRSDSSITESNAGSYSLPSGTCVPMSGGSASITLYEIVWERLAPVEDVVFPLTVVRESVVSPLDS